MITEEEQRLWQESYQGEVLGEAFFARMRDLASDGSEKDKIGYLVRLERSTKEMLIPSLRRHGLPTEPDSAVVRSMETLDQYDWTAMLEGVRPVASEFLVKYRRLSDLVSAEDRQVAEALVAHELALDEFCRLELEGQTERSVDRIQALPHFR